MPKNLKIKILSALFILLLISIISFSFYFLSVDKIALALSSNYSKATGGQLPASEWNNLPNDFVARTGGATSAMQGALDMGNRQINNLSAPSANGDAVNLGAMNTAISALSSIKDTSGTKLKMVCGIENKPWNNVPLYSDAVTVYVDTSAANFKPGTFPHYFSTLHGTQGHWRTTGANSLYGSTYQGYTVYISDLNLPSAAPDTASRATAWGWYIEWCGIGE